MKLYFGNAVATATTLMILAMLGFIGFRCTIEKAYSIGEEEARSFWCSDLWRAVSPLPVTDLTRPYRTQ